MSLAGESTSPIDGTTVHGPRAIGSAAFDAAIIQGKVLVDHPELAESDTPLAYRLVRCLSIWKHFTAGADDNILRIDLIEGARQTLLAQARRGDFFICSNQTQRDHWLGWLSAAGRVNHHNHDADPTMAHLIDVAPFGLDRILEPPSSESEAKRRRLRGMFGQIGPDDPILVWAGGLHDWLDPVTVVRAMPPCSTRTRMQGSSSLRDLIRTPRSRRWVPGVGRSQPQRNSDCSERRSCSSINGCHTTNVFDWIADGSIGVVAHHDHVETRNSHRTRLLDHLAVGLPTVSSGGDPASDLLRAEVPHCSFLPVTPRRWGRRSPGWCETPIDVTAMGRAARTLAGTMHWEQTLGPLVKWMENPSPAPDRVAGAVPDQEVKNSTGANLDRVIRRTRLHWDDGGARQVVDRTIQAGRRRLGR